MFRLVPATANNLAWFFDLHKAALRDYVEPIWGWDETWQRDHFAKTLDIENSRLILVSGEPIGRLTVDEKSDHLFLAYIAILPAYQNRGIGSEVVHSIIREARVKGKSLRLSVLRTNPARALYERLGFVITERNETKINMVYKASL